MPLTMVSAHPASLEVQPQRVTLSGTVLTAGQRVSVTACGLGPSLTANAAPLSQFWACARTKVFEYPRVSTSSPSSSTREAGKGS